MHNVALYISSTLNVSRGLIASFNIQIEVHISTASGYYSNIFSPDFRGHDHASGFKPTKVTWTSHFRLCDDQPDLHGNQEHGMRILQQGDVWSDKDFKCLVTIGQS